jgi:hypothetical protein
LLKIMVEELLLSSGIKQIKLRVAFENKRALALLLLAIICQRILNEGADLFILSWCGTSCILTVTSRIILECKTAAKRK